MTSPLKKYLLFIIPFLSLFSSCGVYKFNGASIPPNMKTVSIQLFENNAPIVVPYLSQQFTEGLKNRIRNQSRLNTTRENADAQFEGRITDYSIQPLAVNANERANLVRLTITVSVKYTNSLENEDSFEQSFSRYTDFSLDQGSVQTQEPKLIPIVTDMLTEDIFNRAFANW